MLFSDTHEPGDNNRVSCMVLEDVDGRDRSQGKGLVRESGLGRPMGLLNGGGMGVTGEEEGTRPERVGGEIADNKSRALDLKVITLN